MSQQTVSAVAMMSLKVRNATRSLYYEIEQLGYSPIVITDKANKLDIECVIGEQAALSTVFCENIKDPVSTAQIVERALHNSGLILHSLVNVVDALTPTMLMICETIELDFDFLESYKRCRTKSHARNAITSAGLSAVRFELVDIFNDTKAPSLPYPYVAKPIMGAGSNFVYEISDDAAWLGYRSFLRKHMSGAEVLVNGVRPFRQILIEQSLPGQMFQVDGFCIASELVVCGLGRKHHHVRRDSFKQGFAEVGGIQYRPFSIPVYAEDDRAIIDWANRICKALKFRSGTFHLEGMLTRNGIELIEMNPRPGGGEVVSIVESLSGVNLTKQMLPLWLGRKPEDFPRVTPINSVLYAILYPPGPAVISTIRPPADVDIPVLGSLKGRWLPDTNLSANSPVGEQDGEEYLGELHVHNFVPAAAVSLKDTVEKLAQWARQDGRFIGFSE